MKKNYLSRSFLNIKKNQFIVFLFIFGFQFFITVKAQSIPSSERPLGVCTNCFPPGWVIDQGTPDVSNASQAASAGSAGGGATWNVPGGVLPLPPNGHTTWISLRDLGAGPTEEIISTTMTGLTVGFTYEVTLYTLTATTNADGQAGVAYASDYIDEFRYVVGSFPMQTISPISQDVWGTDTFRFVATSTTETLQLLPGSNAGGPPNNVETIQISVTLNAIVNVPVAIDDTVVAIENTVLNGDVLINNLNGADQIGVGPTTVTSFDALSINGGVVNVSANGSFSYTPPLDFFGVDSFSYTITDSNGATSSATVTVIVRVDSDGDGQPDDVDADADGDGILNVDECSIATSTNADWTNSGFDIYTIGGLTDGSGNTASGWDADVTANGGVLTNITDWGAVSTPFVGPGYTISHSTVPAALFSAVGSPNNNSQSGTGGTGILITPPDADVSAPFTFTTTITFASSMNAASFDLLDLFDIPTGYQMNVEIEVDGTLVWQTILSDGVGANATGIIGVADGLGAVQPSQTFGNNIENFVGIISPFGFSTITINYIVPSAVAIATVADAQGFDNLRFGTFASCDDDGDLVPNFLDLDSDNDGIPDIDEGNGDIDGDLIPNFLDVDADGDGIFDVHESGSGLVNPDPNGDGMIDAATAAAVGTNGLLDALEAPADSGVLNYTLLNTDADGFINALDIDDDGDSVYTIFENPDPNGDGDPADALNTDADADANYLDIDDDGDSVYTIFESPDANADGDPADALNTDGDADANYLDIDDDGDSVHTIFENPDPNADGDPADALNTDGDGDANYLDIDDDGDSVYTIFENPDPNADGDPADALNTDGDADANYLDIDDDGDSVYTIFESPDANADGDPADALNTDGDADANYLDIDDDGDSVYTIFENPDPNGDGDPADALNTDGDADANYLDIDDDGDSVYTIFENPDPNGDGDPADALNTDGDADANYLDDDDDNDNILTINENPDPNGDGDPADAQNTDGTPPVDFLDIDDDGDGIDTADEDADGDGNPLNDDSDGDGIPNYLDLDSDNDSILDSDETFVDTDGDTVPNYIDLDSDNDGIYDIIEAGNQGLTINLDTNLDGRIDGANAGSVGANGIYDPIEAGADSGTLQAIYLPNNSDSAGAFDFMVLDADADGCFDVLEAGFPDGTLPADDGILGVNAPPTVNLTNGLVINPGAYTTLPDDIDSNNIFDFQEFALPTSITTQPVAPAPILVGGSANINIVAVANVYQWQVSTTGSGGPFTNIANGANYAGVTTANLVINNAPLAFNGNFYRVVVSTNNYACDVPINSDAVELTVLLDSDGDLVADIIDLDDDNDGIPDTDENAGGVAADVDGDGVINSLDLDSDNDGIYDIVESGQINGVSVLDNVVDGRIDGADSTTVGANGLFDLLETAVDSGVLINPTADSTADSVTGLPAPNGIVDSNEIDADNDNCFDVVEAGFGAEDTDGNGVLGTTISLVTNPVTGVVDLGASGLTLGYTSPDNINGGPFDFQEFNFTSTITTQPTTPAPILPGGSTTITGLVSTGNVYQWQVSTTGVGGPFTNIANGANYAGVNTAVLTITNAPLAFNGNFYRVVVSTNNYACDTPVNSDAVELTVQLDSDGDGIPNVTDLDDDNDGIPDADENAGGVAIDVDGDGVINTLDLDSDNDGIYDIVESGQINGTTVVDVDNDGRIDGADATTVGTNGLFDAIETDDTGAATVTQPTADSSTVGGVPTPNGIVDSNELDADTDTCFDVIEAGFSAEDTDNNGILGTDVGLTVDANGVVNTPGLTLGYTTPIDFGNDGTFDFQVFGIGVQPITTQPADQVIVINAPAVFSVNGQPVTFQWQERVNAAAPWANVSDAPAVVNVSAGYSGTNTNQLTLTMVPGSYDGYQYRVILSSPAFACDTNIPSNPATLTVNSDFDGDGIGDPLDIDADNDGIPNIDEYPNVTGPLNDPYGDPDGDGSPNFLDPQPNNAAVIGDGVTVNPNYDTDGDGEANHLDIDSDGDGLYDVYESGNGLTDPDPNADGFIDAATSATVGTNGLYDPLETTPDSGVINYTIIDTDSDGTNNFLDIDDDGDGVNTINESADPNGDGNPADAIDLDADGYDNYLDIDDDGDGILTSVEGTSNFDGDSRANYLDLDSDNDGITDNVEGQSTAGYIAPSGTINVLGLDTAYEATNGIQPVNTDLTFTVTDLDPDYLDLDSDNDTVLDNIEAYDFNENGFPDTTPIGDTDNDGLDDAYDGDIPGYGDPNGLIITTTPAADLPDTDGTEDVNYRDFDDDGDSVYTMYEDGETGNPLVDVDTDGNGIPNYLDNDDDGDTILTINENPDPDGNGNPSDAQNTDGEGAPDYLDVDDDNDGVNTADEDPNGNGDPLDDNSDGDGVANYLDIDDDNDGILTIVEGNNGDDEDGDGYPNYLDQDADGDGLPDNVEGQTTEGYILPAGADDDNDGLDNAYDDNNSGYPNSEGINPENTDGADNPDYLDEDSDNDRVPDFVEAFDFSDPSSLIIAPDGNPDIEFSNVDIDEDGLDDAFDGDTSGFGDPNGIVVNTDPAQDLPNRDLFITTFYGNSSGSPFSPVTPDNIPDYRDTDDDGDGFLTDSPQEDRDTDGNPRNDNCNGPPDNVTPNYLDPISCDRIPDGFSPNGDDNNDTFIIPALDVYPNFSMEIYDRWGNRVYKYDNNGRTGENIQWWDGFSDGNLTIGKGKKVPVGTYYYIINFNGTDRRSPISGWVYVNY